MSVKFMTFVSNYRQLSLKRYRQLLPVIIKYRLAGTEIKRMFLSDRTLIRP